MLFWPSPSGLQTLTALPPLLPEVCSSVGVVDTNDNNHAIAFRIDDARVDHLLVVAWPIEDPAAGRSDTLDATTALRLRLMTGWATRIPHAAFSDARVVSRRYAQVRPILVVTHNDHARRARGRWLMTNDGYATSQGEAQRSERHARKASLPHNPSSRTTVLEILQGRRAGALKDSFPAVTMNHAMDRTKPA